MNVCDIYNTFFPLTTATYQPYSVNCLIIRIFILGAKSFCRFLRHIALVRVWPVLYTRKKERCGIEGIKVALPVDMKKGMRNLPLRTRARKFCRVLPSKGRAPHTNTYNTTPKLYTEKRQHGTNQSCKAMARSIFLTSCHLDY